ncbi:MAG: DUF642 domain-containing protein [Lacipirellulaceae bacterium]
MTRTFATTASLLVAFLCHTAAGNLVTNGSFENPIVPVGGFTNYPGGSSVIAGWTVVGVDTALVNTTAVDSGITFQAQEGAQWADLAGIVSNSSSSGVRQSIPTTLGALYTVEFYVGSATDNRSYFPTTIDLSIDGGPRVSYVNPATPTTSLDWLRFEAPFVAAGPSTMLTFFNGGTPNNFLSGLDNVSVTLVPEPTTAALLVGLALASPWRRRRCRCN